jgi:hypothetical protein
MVVRRFGDYELSRKRCQVCGEGSTGTPLPRAMVTEKTFKARTQAARS